MGMDKTLILSSGKCSWAKCYACGWGKLEAPVDVERLKARVESTSLLGVTKLKVFASGSFLDDAQFPRAFRQWFADYIRASRVKELVIESRPEYITPKSLSDFKGISLTVAIGLECADDKVLRAYHKGFTVAQWLKAVRLLRKNRVSVRTYVMVNIPFGNDKALERTVKLALKESDSVVLINTFPHSKAELFGLWVIGKWKPLDKKEFDKAVGKWKKDRNIELDFQNYAFVPKIPKERQEFIKGVGIACLDHPHYNVWQDYFVRFYERPKEKDIALFLPCSYRKPYSGSRTHKEIYEAIKEAKIFPRLHRIVLSSPGVIPFEFSDYYPFNSYDWPEWLETTKVKRDYIKFVKARVKAYLKTHKYKRYLCYFKYSAETYIALKEACKELKIPLKNLLDEKVYNRIKDEKNPIVHEKALKNLRNNLTKASN
jgi:archaeosine synthase